MRWNSTTRQKPPTQKQPLYIVVTFKPIMVIKIVQDLQCHFIRKHPANTARPLAKTIFAEGHFTNFGEKRGLTQ